MICRSIECEYRLRRQGLLDQAAVGQPEAPDSRHGGALQEARGRLPPGLHFDRRPLKNVLEAIAKVSGLELRPWKDEGSRQVTIDVGGKTVTEALEAVVRQIDGEGVVMIRTWAGLLGPAPRGGPASRVVEKHRGGDRDEHPANNHNAGQAAGTTITGRIRTGRHPGDFRYAARALARSPGFTFAVGAILALGIGLNVTMFGAVNAFLLRPLPYPDDDRLVYLDEHAAGQSGTMKVALANFADWQDRQRVFTAMAAYRRSRVSLSGSGEAESVDSLTATAALFRVLGVAPAAGRGFAAEDAEPGAPLVAVISDLLWRSRFAGRPMVGETIRVNGAPPRPSSASCRLASASRSARRSGFRRHSAGRPPTEAVTAGGGGRLATRCTRTTRGPRCWGSKTAGPANTPTSTRRSSRC